MAPAAGALPRVLLPLSVVFAILAVLIALPWETDVKYDLPRDTEPVEQEGPLDMPDYTRTVHCFESHGTRCEAWIYLPKSTTRPPPVVMMANGLGAQKDMGLHPYAEHFVRAGLGVFMFDYRTYGGSDGEPRHWASPRRYLEDWFAAVQHVQETQLDGRVDPHRLVLWGVSYAGGHVLYVASRLGNQVSAVIANEPYLTAAGTIVKAMSERGWTSVGRSFAAALSDELRRMFGMKPAYIPLVGRFGELALLAMQDSEYEARKEGMPPRRQGGWKNLVAARFLLEASSYRPLDSVHNITAPVFFRVATQDHLCPPEAAKQAAALVQAETVIQERDLTHLGAHRRGWETEEIAPVIDFIKKHVGGVEDASRDVKATPAQPASME